MSPRSIRRAAERKAAKLARKADRANAAAVAVSNSTVTVASAVDATAAITNQAAALGEQQTETVEKAFAASAGGYSNTTEEEPTSPARLAANRANAQLSTGPRTPAGKAKSSLNAIKTGLTGQTVVLPNEDGAAYEAHVARFFAKHNPANPDEHALVQSIADYEFRLARIAPLESAIFAIGEREFANEFEDEPNLVARKALIRGKVMLAYRRDLSNLTLQERRLRNHRDQDVAKLETLQTERQKNRATQVAHSQMFLKRETTHNQPFKPADFGFDFSVEEIKAYLDRTSAQYSLTAKRPDLDKFLAEYRAAQKGDQAA